MIPIEIEGKKEDTPDDTRTMRAVPEKREREEKKRREEREEGRYVRVCEGGRKVKGSGIVWYQRVPRKKVKKNRQNLPRPRISIELGVYHRARAYNPGPRPRLNFIIIIIIPSTHNFAMGGPSPSPPPPLSFFD